MMCEWKNQKFIAGPFDSWSGFFMGQFILCHADHTSGFKSICRNVLPPFHCFYMYYPNIRKNVSKIISKRGLETPAAHGSISTLSLFFI